MLRTGHTIDDIGGALSWDALSAFLRHLGPDTETARELDPELTAWVSTAKTNAILADIFDVLAQINTNLCALGSGKAAKKPPAYKRPGDNRAKHIGKNALPISDLRAFFARKREQYKQREVNGHD